MVLLSRAGSLRTFPFHVDNIKEKEVVALRRSKGSCAWEGMQRGERRRKLRYNFKTNLKRNHYKNKYLTYPGDSNENLISQF